MFGGDYRGIDGSKWYLWHLKGNAMTKYIVFASVLVLCCSFTICDKLEEQKDKTWKLYIYPFCEDTTTYVVRDCRIKPAYKERDYVKRSPWKNHPIEYIYMEHFFISGVEKQISTYSYRKEGGKLITRYTDENKYDGGRSMYVSNTRMCEAKSYTFSDSLHLGVDYFKNGAIKSYRMENWNTGDAVAMEWDSLYQYKWQGKYKSGGVVDTLQSFDGGTETIKIIIHSSEKKDGTWIKYNRKGELIEQKKY